MSQENYSTKSIREIAVDVVFEVLENGAYTNIHLDKNLRSKTIKQNDKSFITEMVNGTVRMHKHLDWVLNLFLKTKIEKQNPWLRNILRLSVYQIIYMDKIPNYAIVDDAVKLSKKKTNKILANVCNGVLRNLIRNKNKIKIPEGNLVEQLAISYSHPEWLVDYFINEFGYNNTLQILKYNNERAVTVLRNNSLKGTEKELILELKDEKIDVIKSTFVPNALIVDKITKPFDDIQAFRKGKFYIQNEGSMLASLILNPISEEIVYDLCCGLGGKTTHIAELMENKGVINAYDIYEHKLALLKANCERLGIVNVVPRLDDVLNIEESSIADKVLLDAPCSGLGVLNRRADSRWRKTIDEIKDLTELQIKLLTKAIKLVKPGGSIVYSTCTINKAENENVVQKILQEQKEYYLEGFAKVISFFPLDEEDQICAEKGMLTLLPGKYLTDGMFYARIRRKG